jgi:hypothetical protein
MTTLMQDPEVYDDRAALGLLLEHHPAHLSREELALELCWAEDRVSDALRRLARSGLAHVTRRFAFATRSRLSRPTRALSEHQRAQRHGLRALRIRDRRSARRRRSALPSEEFFA